MPRQATKDILRTASFGQASGRGRPRLCRTDRRNHTISTGDWYLTIKDGLDEKSYCLECARTILERGSEKIGKLFTELDQLDEGSHTSSDTTST